MSIGVGSDLHPVARVDARHFHGDRRILVVVPMDWTWQIMIFFHHSYVVYCTAYLLHTFFCPIKISSFDVTYYVSGKKMCIFILVPVSSPTVELTLAVCLCPIN